MRLLAERTGLRAGLSRAMHRRGFDPVYDRGQVLIDMAVAQILGAEAISDFQGLRHLGPVIGPAAVLVRLALDPLDYTYYSVAPQLLVLVGCGLLPTAARPARVLAVLALCYATFVLPVLAIPICAGVVLPLLRRSEVAPPVRR